MSENYSKFVDNKTFTCIIELFEENTEYEILVVPETASRKLILNAFIKRALFKRKPNSAQGCLRPIRHVSAMSNSLNKGR